MLCCCRLRSARAGVNVVTLVGRQILHAETPQSVWQDSLALGQETPGVYFRFSSNVRYWEHGSFLGKLIIWYNRLLDHWLSKHPKLYSIGLLRNVNRKQYNSLDTLIYNDPLLYPQVNTKQMSRVCITFVAAMTAAVAATFSPFLPKCTSVS